MLITFCFRHPALLYLLIIPFLGDQSLELGQGDCLARHGAPVWDGFSAEVVPYDSDVAGGWGGRCTA